MGGYGHNLSNLLKNSRRKERKAYDGWTASEEKSQGIKAAPVSEEVLEEIRMKMKKQKVKEKRTNVIFIFISLITAIFFMCLLFFYFQNDPGISFPSR